MNPAPFSESIPSRFDRVASRFPERSAIGAPGAKWTYAELSQRANFIAGQLLNRLGDKSQPVALLMEYDAPLIAAIFAVLKAGKIYLALDPNDSNDRLAAILADSEPRLLITDQKNSSLAGSLAAGQLSILQVVDDFTAPPTHTNFPEVPGEAGAWLMYTSGSTGPPKAVWQNHRGIVHDADVYSELIQLTPDDRLSMLTSCSLAASATQLFTALLNGAMLCPFHVRSQGAQRLAIWLCEQGITIYHSVPTVFRQLTRAASDNGPFANLRLIRLGGEPVLRNDVEIFRQRCPDDCRLMNALSSTETGPISAEIIEKNTVLPDGRVPVGRAVRDVEIFLTDEQGHPVAKGCTGRIAVRSACLRQGYWRRPDETAEKFRIDPQVPDTRIFITNDLGRFLPDGNLEHLGRVDEVVKIGGLRVDLVEVETALRASNLVEEAVVTALQDPSDGYRLVACVVPRAKTDGSSHVWRGALQQLLPGPSRLLVLQELPLLGNGKIDRVYLSKKAAELPTKAKERRDTVDALELQLVRIWEKVLAVEAVATTDDFFALGGDSLAAVTMLAAVEKFCGVALPISCLLEATAVQKLADLIRSGGLGETDLRLVALRLRGNKPPLYWVPWGESGSALAFRMLARYLPEDQPIFAFQPRRLDGRSPYLYSVEEMAKSYVDVLRAHQPRGPYYLCGASFGGVVAFEMARRLVIEGEEVRFLGLLDSYGGEYPKHRKSLALRKKLKLMLLHFLPRPSYFVTLASLKVGLKEQMKRWLVRRIIALDRRVQFRAFRCPFNLQIFYIQEVCFAARRRYKLIPFSGKIDLFTAEHHPPSDLFEEDPLLGWGGMAAGGIEVHQFPGNHAMYLEDPVIAAVVAAQLGACLEQASS